MKPQTGCKRKETEMTKIHCATAFLIGASFIAAPVLAGEIKGPPPTDNIPGPPGTSVSNGNSNCSYSGLNDTPDGFGTPGTPTYDPGGQVQSFGYFMSHFDVADPSDPDDRSSFGFPSQGCNPQHTFGRH
jgi:hypothetical protein